MLGRLTSQRTFLPFFFLLLLYNIRRCRIDAGIYNRMKLKKTGRSCHFLELKELFIKIYKKIIIIIILYIGIF